MVVVVQLLLNILHYKIHIGLHFAAGNILLSQVEQNEEALGPVDFKEVLEKLEKDTKQLHKMGLLTGEKGELEAGGWGDGGVG